VSIVGPDVDVVIRAAIGTDIAQIAAFDEHVGPGSQRLAALGQAIDQRRGFVVESAGTVLGYAIVSHGFFGRSFIDLIYVDARARGCGYGPQLLRFLEGEARTNELFTSTNASNAHMQHVLTKLGWQRSGSIENLDPGDPEIVWYKRLP
jgi:ribosomal protein S18 acetylase RimI-like enzyme